MPYSPSRYHSFRENYVEVRYLLSIYISVDLCNQKAAYYCCFTYFEAMKMKKGGMLCPVPCIWFIMNPVLKLNTFYNVIQV